MSPMVGENLGFHRFSCLVFNDLLTKEGPLTPTKY
jgi:hypothetical protein